MPLPELGNRFEAASKVRSTENPKNSCAAENRVAESRAWGSSQSTSANLSNLAGEAKVPVPPAGSYRPSNRHLLPE